MYSVLASARTQASDVADVVALARAHDEAAPLQERERLVHGLARRADHLREALLREIDVDHHAFFGLDAVGVGEISEAPRDASRDVEERDVLERFVGLAEAASEHPQEGC